MGRKIFLCVGLVWAHVSINAAVITWDGEGADGHWSNALNWSGNTIPGSADDVVIDNSIVSGNYTITLPDLAVVIRSISILPNSGFHIIVLLPSSNTIALNSFVTTGTGYSFLLGNGATFINGATVTSGTNLSISDSLQIQNGGRYVHRTRSGHATWLAKLSKMSNTISGTIEFDVPVSSYVVSLSGRTYGNLVLSSVQHGSPVTYSGNGAQNVNVKGELHLLHSATLTLSFSGGEFIVDGDFHLANLAVFNIQASSNNNVIRFRRNVYAEGTILESGTGNPRLIFGGAFAQQVAIRNLQGSIITEISNEKGVTLIAPLSISHILRLLSGRIYTSATSLLTIQENASIEGASFERYIVGPMKKIGDEAFVFPVGKGLQYASIAISEGVDVTDEFIAEYFQGNPMLTFGSTLETPGITHMSSLEWWELERKVGSAARSVTLLVTTYSDATLLEHLRVLRFDGTIWKNEGNVSYAGLSFGTIISQPVEQFNSGTPTAFTLGSSSATVNPLPVIITSFNAFRDDNGKVAVAWSLAGNPESPCTFAIERDCGSGFNTLAVVNGRNDSKDYEYKLHTASSAACRYRIKIESEVFGIVYSNIILAVEEPGALQMSHNITDGSVTIWCPVMQNAEMMVIDMYGRMLSRKKIELQKGKNNLYLHDALSKGVRIVVIRLEDGTVKSLKF